MERNLRTPETTIYPYKSPSLGPLAVNKPTGILTKDENRSAVEKVFKFFSSCPVGECPLNFPLTHAISLYSNILFCMECKHYDGPSFNYSQPFETLCAFEKIILLSVQHDRNFKPAHIGRFDIYCEQDIESITYKLYAAKSDRDKRMLTISDCYFILEILLCRREYDRFFTVYDNCEHTTLGMYKLALLAALYANNKKASKILATIKSALKITDEIDINDPIPEIDKRFKDIVDEAAETGELGEYSKEESLALFYAIMDWYIDKYKEFHWSVYLNTWKTSKNTGGVSEAMIDKCIRFKKYEEGWNIYKESALGLITPLRLFRLSRRILSLVIHAINNYTSNMWVERYLEVATVISRLKISPVIKIRSTLSVLLGLNSYTQISCLGGLVIRQYPEELLNNNIALCVMFSVAYEVFKTHENIISENSKDESLPELAKCVFIVYRMWRKKSVRSVFVSLFWGRSSESVDVYTTILQIAVIIKNKTQVASICRDIWNDSLSLTMDLSNTLVHIHNMYSECKCGDTANIRSRSYLMHILSFLPSTK